VAVGVFAAGQVAVGLAWGVGMVGLGGRGMLGVLRFLPALRKSTPPRDAPATVPLSALLSGTVREGYLPVRIHDGAIVLPDGAAPHVDATSALAQARTAEAAGETAGVLGVAAYQRPEEGAGYRDGAASRVRLEAAALVTWRPPGWRFVSYSGEKTASTLEVSLRVLAWLVLVAVVGFVLFGIGM
jgi:hypothetical protein